MLFLHEYIKEWRGSGTRAKIDLANHLDKIRRDYDVHAKRDPRKSLTVFVKEYNWLGLSETKRRFNIDSNLARNLPGALMQDYLLHLSIAITKDFPKLEVFTEVRVPFGLYPLWNAGKVVMARPAEKSDTAVGYLVEKGEVKLSNEKWPRQPFYHLNPNQSVIPLVTINSKIRISQSEFFDWQGREQLMTKGNPHCLSIQVALRKEMDMDIVEAAQAGDKFFLLGAGGERNVIPNPRELERLEHVLHEHLVRRMSATS